MERGRLWRRWVVIVAAGELVGFAVPAVVGIMARDASSGTQLAVMPAAGIVEGAMLGLAQAVVLRRQLTGFNPRAWVVSTSLAASLAWFLGMLPSTTHDTWSTWSLPGVAATAAVLGVTLLASIGTAQALVLPRGTRGRRAWVGWTALGWCAGLTAFSAVSPPLWQPGQEAWLLVLIGVAGGLAMAVAMAAVTGVGAVRLGDPLHDDDAGSTPGRHLVSTLLGTVVYDASGNLLGRIRDLVADLAPDPDRPPVTHVVIGASHGRRLVAPYSDLVPRSGDGLTLSSQPEPTSPSVPGTTGLLLRRDVLDSPVVLAEPPHRTRVSEVVLEVGPEVTRVVGVDVTSFGWIRRLARTGELPASVPLSTVHLGSRHGHAAQLAAPDSHVLALPADGMAELLTRVPVTHARDIIRAADRRVREDALRLLHPLVRARVTGSDSPPRRTRRFSGWRLHRPGTHPPSGDGE